MSIIKSFSVGDGDMFYIDHNSDNFSIIDCYMDENNRDEIVEEIVSKSGKKALLDSFPLTRTKIIYRGLSIWIRN